MSTDTTTDLPEMTKKLAERMHSESSAAVPAATARHSVLIGPGGTIPIIRPPPPLYTLAGRTANFDVAYDNNSGGQALAAILGSCEQDLSQLRSFFGGVSTGRFSVFIDAGTPGPRNP
jgi:hypothetical protein